MQKSKAIEYKLIVGAATLPITLDEAKLYLRVTTTSEDALITSFIEAATTAFENYSGRDLINKTYKAFLDSFPAVYMPTGPSYSSFDYHISPGGIVFNGDKIQLPKSRVSSITMIQYFSGGSLITWDATNYILLEDVDLGEISLDTDKSYPTDADRRRQAIEITFVAGFGASADDIPADIKQGLLAYVAFMYENRGDCPCIDDLPIQFKSIYQVNKIWLV